MLSKIRGRLAILRELERPRNYGLLLAIFGLALITPWVMRLQLSWVAKRLTPSIRPSSPDQQQIEQVLAYTDAVIRTFRPLIQDRCLTRGLTRYYFLRRIGLPVELHFGAGYVDNAFEGHCWLVKDGQAFAETDDLYQLFTPTYQFPGLEQSR